MSDIKKETQSIVKWTVITPVFSIWPLVSTFPFIGLLMPQSGLSLAANFVFALTGFFGLAGIAFLLNWLQDKAPDADRYKIGQLGAGRIAAYAGLWLTAYAAFLW